MSDDPAMPAPPTDLLARLRTLPAAAPLLPRLAGAEDVYLVGGAVRDLLLGGAPVDLDLVVDGDIAPVAARLGTPVRSHDRFATCTVVLDGFRYDLARARRETYPRPGALPEVTAAGIEEDLRRRDFTVNALALGLGGAARGRLLAAPRGLEDLEARLLRVLHAESFIDDPTRLLRLARYAARLGFSVEDETASWAAAALAGGALETVSGSRIGTELRLAAAEADPVAAFQMLHALGVDAAIAPGFGLAGAGDVDLARRALALLPPDGNPGAVVLAVAGRSLDGRAFARLLDDLAFPARPRDAIVAAATRGPALAQALRDAESPSEIAAAARGAPPELVALAGALGPAQAARRWLEDLRHVALEIGGEDLLQAGVPAGPEVGRALGRALSAKLDGRASGRAAELAAALGRG